MTETAGKLTIAVLAKSFRRTGGMERYAVEVARRMLERGHRVDLYGREVDRDLLPGANFVEVSSRFRYSSVGSALAFARETARLLQGRRYDVVHSHERGYCQDVLTMHCFSHRCGLGKYTGLRRIDQLYFSPRNALYLWLERRQMRSPWLVAVSERIREDIRCHYGREEQVAVIPPGVDTQWFAPSWVAANRHQARVRLGCGEGEVVVLFVGSEFRRKGLDQLIPAVGDRMRLVVVGSGERLEHYQRLVRECGLDGRVHFAGLASDVRSYYGAADVVALPSLSEAFGMSVLEAMSCGIPAVVTANAGVAALIDHGANGLVVRDATELKGALATCMDPVLRRRMGEKARETALAFSWDAVALAHEELYYRIAADKARRDSGMAG